MLHNQMQAFKCWSRRVMQCDKKRKNRRPESSFKQHVRQNMRSQQTNCIHRDTILIRQMLPRQMLLRQTLHTREYNLMFLEFILLPKHAVPEAIQRPFLHPSFVPRILRRFASNVCALPILTSWWNMSAGHTQKMRMLYRTNVLKVGLFQNFLLYNVKCYLVKVH